MDEINFDAEFAKMTDGLDLADTEVTISMFEIAHTLEAIHEACAFLAEYMSIQVSLPANLQLEFPESLIPVIPHFRRTAEMIADELHSAFHVDCEDCDDEDEEGDDL